MDAYCIRIRIRIIAFIFIYIYIFSFWSTTLSLALIPACILLCLCTKMYRNIYRIYIYKQETRGAPRSVRWRLLEDDESFSCDKFAFLSVAVGVVSLFFYMRTPMTRWCTFSCSKLQTSMTMPPHRYTPYHICASRVVVSGLAPRKRASFLRVANGLAWCISVVCVGVCVCVVCVVAVSRTQLIERKGMCGQTLYAAYAIYILRQPEPMPLYATDDDDDARASSVDPPRQESFTTHKGTRSAKHIPPHNREWRERESATRKMHTCVPYI